EAESAGAHLPPERLASPARATTFIEIELLDPEGNPVEGHPFRLVLPTGETRNGKLDRQGRAKVTGLPPGTSQVSFPEVDQAPAAAAVPPPDAPPPASIDATEIGIELVNAAGQPVPAAAYRVLLPDGTSREGTLDVQGRAVEKDVPPGTC